MKWLSWLMKICATALVVTVISLYTTWTVVQTYLTKVLDHYQLSAGIEKVEFSDLLASIGSDLNIMKQPASKQSNSQAEQGKVVSAVVQPSDGGKSTGKTGGDAVPANQSGTTDNSVSNPGKAGGTGTNSQSNDYPVIEDALPVWSQSSSSQAQQQGSQQSQKEELGQKTVVSAENLSSTKDRITNEDKMKLFSLLISKLPPAEVQTISTLMEDGITQQELLEMNAIIQKHLSTDEYNQVVTILEKYQ